MKYYKRISGLLFTLIFLMLNSSIAFAGTSGTPGGSGGGSGGGGSSNSMFKMGTSYSRKGLQWANGLGNVNWSSPAPFANQAGGNTFKANAVKWANIQKWNNSTNSWFNFRWSWWFSIAHLQNPIHYIQNSYYTKVWQSLGGQLTDNDLVNTAKADGFYYNAGKQLYERSDGVKLDIAWTNDIQQQSVTTPGTTIVAADIDGVALMPDRSNESAQSLYFNPTASIPYSGKSLPTELNHKKIINATFMHVTRTVTTYIIGKDKAGNDIIERDISYSKGSKYSISREIKYDVEAPLITQTFFKPFDLNKNGLADDSDVNQTYPNYDAGNALLMSVDNKQNIVDGTLLKTLDTNASLFFNITFKNSQFGIPNKTENGFDIIDSAPGIKFKNPDETYKNSVIESVGSNGTYKTGELSSGSMVPKDIDGNISKDSYWNMSAKAGISDSNGSLTYGDSEKVGGDEFSFIKGWNGGNFAFKTTTMGTYNLGANSRPWWEVQYEQGEFYGYGISYSGTISVGSISEPTVNQSNLYARLGTSIMVQPILKGTIEAKTIGGTIK